MNPDHVKVSICSSTDSRVFRVQRTDVVDGDRQLDVAKMPRAFCLAFTASGAHLAAVDRAELGVVQTLLAWAIALLVHGLGILDVTDTHALNLFGREESELDLLHRLEGRVRMHEVRHVGGWEGGTAVFACRSSSVLAVSKSQSESRLVVVRIDALRALSTAFARCPPPHSPVNTAQPREGGRRASDTQNHSVAPFFRRYAWFVDARG